MSTLKFLHDVNNNDDNLAITTARLFLWNRRGQNDMNGHVMYDKKHILHCNLWLKICIHIQTLHKKCIHIKLHCKINPTVQYVDERNEIRQKKWNSSGTSVWNMTFMSCIMTSWNYDTVKLWHGIMTPEYEYDDDTENKAQKKICFV